MKMGQMKVKVIQAMTRSKRDFLITGPKRTPLASIILAHGAGAPMDSDFMNQIAEGLAECKIRVIRFEFPYMAERRVSGKKRPPNSEKVLIEKWLEVIRYWTSKGQAVYIGGKSMGGRIATQVADLVRVQGVVCLGYPFHPPGKPDKLRTEHLKTIETPTLILQGERDPFGSRQEVPKFHLSRKVTVKWIPDGDHGLKPRKASGLSLESNLHAAISNICRFVAPG